MLNGMFDVNPEAAASKDNSEEGSRVMPSEPVAFCIGSEEGSREMPLEPVAFCIGAELREVRAGLSFCQVFKKGASERAGVVVGDVLLTLNEKAVSSLEDVKSNLMLCSNDNSVRLTLRSTDGSGCDRVLQCNTAVRQEPDACDRIGTPETAQVAQNVQREADSTPEICGIVRTDALVKGKDEKTLAERTKATYNSRTDTGEEGCAAAPNIGVGAACVELTGGSVCERVSQCNTAVRQEPDACDRIGTPETAQVAQNVQPEAASTPEICDTVPTDALVQGKDEKVLAKWTQATYNCRADAGEEGCAAAANIGVGAARVALTGTGAGPTERRDLENSQQATTPEPAPRSDTMATGRCLNPNEVIEGSATDSETIASSKKTDIKAESTHIKRKFADVSSLNSQASLLENFEVYISLNICVFWCSFDICIECINKCLICIFFHLYRQLHRTDLTQFNII